MCCDVCVSEINRNLKSLCLSSLEEIEVAISRRLEEVGILSCDRSHC